MFCHFVRSDAKPLLKARHGVAQDEILGAVASWRFGE